MTAQKIWGLALGGLVAATFVGLSSGGCASTSPSKATPTFTRKPSSTPVPDTSTPTVPAGFTPTSVLIVTGGSDIAGSVSINEVLSGAILPSGDVAQFVQCQTMPTPIFATGILAVTSGHWITKGQGHVQYGHPGEPMGSSWGFSNYSAFAPATPPCPAPWADGTAIAKADGTPVFSSWVGAAGDGTHIYTVDDLDVYSAPIIGGGPDAWTYQSSLPADRNNVPLVIADGYLFAICGREGAATITSTIFKAPLTGGGVVGAWTSENPFPITLRRAPHQAVSYQVGSNWYVCVVGGFDGAATISTVYYAPVTGGSIGTWQTSSPMAAALSYGDVLHYNGFLYFVGGAELVANSGSSTVYKSQIGSNGAPGPWTATVTMPSERMMTASIVIP